MNKSSEACMSRPGGTGLETRQFQLTAPPVHFAQNLGNPQNAHRFHYLCLPTRDQSRGYCGSDVGTTFVLFSDTLTRIQCDRSLAAVSIQLRKESHKNAFHIIICEMFIWQRRNQAFSPLPCQARLSHKHPAWHIVDCQQIYVIVLKSLDTLLKPGDVVSGACSRQRTSRGSCPSFVVVAVRALLQAWSSRLHCLGGFCQPCVPSCQ